MTRVAAGFSSSGRLRLPPEENPKGSNTKNAQLIIAIDQYICVKQKQSIHSGLLTALRKYALLHG